MLLLPPKTPINGEKTYFQLLCEEANKYIPHINLDFTGYEQLVEQYAEVSEHDSDANYELSKVFNAWFEYFSEVANVIQNQFLDAETDKLSIQAERSILASDKNVSAGDRKANTDPDVISARKKRNALKSLYDSLMARGDFCEKAFYQCKHHCLNAAEIAQQNANGQNQSNSNTNHEDNEHDDYGGF